MKKRISIIMLLTISVLMTGCEELHKSRLLILKQMQMTDRAKRLKQKQKRKKRRAGNGSRGSGRAGQLGNRTSGNGDRI